MRCGEDHTASLLRSSKDAVQLDCAKGAQMTSAGASKTSSSRNRTIFSISLKTVVIRDDLQTAVGMAHQR